MNEGLLEQAEAELQVPKNNEQQAWDCWWCTGCKKEVEPTFVTFEETHDTRQGGCGCKVVGVCDSGDVTGEFEHAMQGIQNYRKNNPMYQINDMEWDDLIEAHNADIAAKDNRIAQLKLMLHAADEANECFRHDILVRDALIARFRTQLAQRSGLVPADKVVG